MRLMVLKYMVLGTAFMSAGAVMAGNEEPVIGARIEPMTDPSEGKKPSETTAANRILVKFSDTIATQRMETVNARLGVTIINTLMDGSLIVVEVPYAAYRDDIIAAYQATEGVLYAEPDQVVSIPTPVPDGDGAQEDAPLIPLPKVE